MDVEEARARKNHAKRKRKREMESTFAFFDKEEWTVEDLELLSEACSFIRSSMRWIA